MTYSIFFMTDNIKTSTRTKGLPMKSLFLLLTCLTINATVFSQTVSTSDQRNSVSVTIYNMGMGLVRENRTITLPKGVSVLRYEDVAEDIIPQSVRVEAKSAKLTVFEQNYEYDLISGDRLMDKYIGKSVTIYKYDDASKREIPVTATLIANNGGPIFKVGNEISLGYPGRITVPTIPNNLFAKPTLLWKLSNESEGNLSLDVSYQTNGMNWSADYVMVLSEDEKSASINSWVTLNNQSGTEFKNATLQLVAGEVQRKSNNQTSTVFRGGRSDMYVAKMEAVAEPSFEQENLSEFYLYTLDQPTDIGYRQTKQVQLFSTNKVNLTKRYIFENLPMYSGNEKNFNRASVRYDFKNSSENQLGRPLPKGIFRVYKADSKGRQQLLGEDDIDHTPNNEEVKIKVGEAFDIVANGKQISFENFTIGNGNRTSYEVSLRNRKKEDVVVRLYANVGGEWKITKNSNKYEKESQYKVYFDVPVKADSEVKVTYTVEQSY